MSEILIVISFVHTNALISAYPYITSHTVVKIVYNIHIFYISSTQEALKNFPQGFCRIKRCCMEGLLKKIKECSSGEKWYDMG